MTEPTPRFWEIFFEVYEPLPRQGPGNRACAAQALGLCRDLPPTPAVLDLGCGVGGQTLHLAARLPGATITAIDSHAPAIERLEATVAKRGLARRVRPMVGDMARPGLPSQSFDLYVPAALGLLRVRVLRDAPASKLPGGAEVRSSSSAPSDRLL